jgi:putative FmdB family regulatory protein
VPIYEFDCEQCGDRFEVLLAAGAPDPNCPSCGSRLVRRRWSQVSPPGRRPRGLSVREDEARRRDREAARQDRLAETKRKRAAGEL